MGSFDRWPVDALGDYSEVYRQRYEDANPDAMVETILLNGDYIFLKHYVKGSVAGTRTDATVARRRRQYALGVSVAIGLLFDQQRKARASLSNGKDVAVMDNEHLDAAIGAAARGVLTLLPDFDSILDEVGIGD